METGKAVATITAAVDKVENPVQGKRWQEISPISLSAPVIPKEKACF